MPANLPKSVSKQQDRLLSSYKRSFKAGDFESGLKASSEYLRRLSQSAKMPHKNFAIGEIALDSCLWALV